MIELPQVPEEKRKILEQLVAQLSRVHGMAAISLGGSYASGTFNVSSDVDIGLYYYECNLFPIAKIRQIARRASTEKPAEVTGFYDWGDWVNGGAWLHTPQGKFDFLYRNLNQIVQTISNAKRGIVWHDYDQQPAYGFYSVIYLAETQFCIPLYDPYGIIANLKKKVIKYPPKLKQKIVADSLWSAEFTLLHARDFAMKGDIYNAAGCLTRAAANLTQVLFALNEQYFLTDKGAIDQLNSFRLIPAGYVKIITRILAHPGLKVKEMTKSVHDFEKLWKSVTLLEGVHYQSKFVI